MPRPITILACCFRRRANWMRPRSNSGKPGPRTRNPGAHNNLGLVFEAQGKLDEAITQFQCAVSLKPDYTEAYLNLGTALRGQGKLDAAVARYQRALETAPERRSA